MRYKLVGGCLHCARKREKFISREQYSADSTSAVSRFVISRAERQRASFYTFCLLDYNFPGPDSYFIVSARPPSAAQFWAILVLARRKIINFLLCHLPSLSLFVFPHQKRFHVSHKKLMEKQKRSACGKMKDTFHAYF